jgi:hypothetical protein
MNKLFVTIAFSFADDAEPSAEAYGLAVEALLEQEELPLPVGQPFPLSVSVKRPVSVSLKQMRKRA